MDVDAADLATFEAERPRLSGIAYRMTSAWSDADDVVQEAWLRWADADRASIRNAAAWLTTVTTRLAIDRIRMLQRRREDYVGPWLPEPVSVERGPEAVVELSESLTLGFLLLLDRLGPTERAVFLLADVFGESFTTIAASVGKSETACRQIASRARRKLRDGSEPSTMADEELMATLLERVVVGDLTAVMELLAPDVVVLTDGGPARHAARRPVVGPARAARFMVNLARRFESSPMSMVSVNGHPALLIERPDGPSVLQIIHREGRVTKVLSMLNLDKLAALDHPVRLT